MTELSGNAFSKSKGMIMSWREKTGEWVKGGNKEINLTRGKGEMLGKKESVHGESLGILLSNFHTQQELAAQTEAMSMEVTAMAFPRGETSSSEGALESGPKVPAQSQSQSSGLA